MNKENKKNILEFTAMKLNQALENDKKIVEILLETNRDLIDLNEKIDKILERWEKEENGN
ncbi:MAG: hypothetical protein IJ690_02045 [Clostridia bacterium]|nr:hypothetical protein [Clostridia bacterium]MBR1653723.1 hypothetical protein [Clostridia bacterium]